MAQDLTLSRQKISGRAIDACSRLLQAHNDLLVIAKDAAQAGAFDDLDFGTQAYPHLTAAIMNGLLVTGVSGLTAAMAGKINTADPGSQSVETMLRRVKGG